MPDGVRVPDELFEIYEGGRKVVNMWWRGTFGRRSSRFVEPAKHDTDSFDVSVGVVDFSLPGVNACIGLELLHVRDLSLPKRPCLERIRKMHRYVPIRQQDAICLVRQSHFAVL